jgi:hypothetical protein
MPNPGSETEHAKDFGASIIVIRVITNLNTHRLSFCPMPKKKKKKKKIPNLRAFTTQSESKFNKFIITCAKTQYSLIVKTQNPRITNNCKLKNM